MTSLTIGLIPSPDVPANIVEKLTGQLVNDLQNQVSQDIDWQIETTVDPLAGAAEYINDVLEKAVRIKKQHDWDYAICLTDLPSFSGRKVVTTDVSIQRGTALMSLPSFGAFPLKKRIRKALTFIIEFLYHNGQGDQSKKTASSIKRLKRRFLLSKIRRVIPQEGASTDTRFILQSRLFGWMRVLSGMTFANRPWLALASFKKVLTLAFATGTYISIFSTPWQLSVAYSPLRFIVLMLLSMVGMVTWIIFAHNLWEKSSSKGQNQYRILYNITTVLTLTSIAVIHYVVLYAAFMLSISLFVPQNLFEAWTKVNADDSIQYFMRLAWLTTSLGMLAGAVGATAEKEENIRHITYSYRQLTRYYEIEQDNPESESSGREDSQQKSYEGTQQSHREEGAQ
ncbi:hypothetical protein GCM10008983_17330 [Lentibacillus halophilus]|uniref:5,10-methylene-tetrahydrofolate dehydrogenase n=1 Tax=Lentibacillus halophilus TaxID=295065 RepID=A0ABP3J3V0_9BACI